MTSSCGLCGAAQRTGTVCHRCASRAHDALTTIIALAPELDNALTTGPSPTSVPARGRGQGRGLPVALPVVDARAHLRAVVRGWAAVVHDTVGGPTPQPSIPACARYLAHNLHIIRTAPYGPDAARELQDAAQRAHRAVDLPIRRIPLPVSCPVIVLGDDGRPRPCGGAVHAVIAPGLPADGLIRCAVDRSHALPVEEWRRRARRRTGRPHLT